MTDVINCKIKVNSKEISMVNPNIQLQAQTGEHTCVILKGIVHQKSFQYLMEVDTLSDIQISYQDDNHILFWGTVTYFDIEVGKSEDKEIRELHLEAKSFSYLLDQIPQNRSFQNQQTLYSEIIELILSSYERANYLMAPDMKGKSTNCFIVQYQETDWCFLKRLASQKGLPLVASHSTYGAKFSAGVLWETSAYVLNEEEKSQLEAVQTAAAYTEDGYQNGQRFLRWRSEKLGNEFFEIGDCIRLENERFYVISVELEIKDYTLIHQYTLSKKQGFEIIEKYNSRLRGLSLPGTVEGVKGNQIQPHLDIDAMSERNCWFTYATFYSTFYCMPEVGDHIYMYFPNDDEVNAYILNSVRTNPIKMGGQGFIKSGTGIMTVETVTPTKTGDSDNCNAVETDQESVIDIAEYIRDFANPEGGILADASVDFTENSAPVAAPVSQMGASPSPGSFGGGGSAGSNGMGGSAGQDFDSMAINEDTKVLSTPDGKRVVLDDGSGSVSIVYDGGTYIVLNGSGIAITTDKAITFSAEGNITLDATNNLILSSSEVINISCGGSLVSLDPAMVAINGTDIKING